MAEKCKKGYKIKDGKCMKIKRKSSNRKSYNPFKMWGSYVGFLVVLALYLKYSWFCMTYAIREDRIASSFFTEIFNIQGANCMGFSIGILVFIIIILSIGFLIGWGVHSLIRRIRK